MEEKDFYQILTKYRLGQASKEEKKLIDTWYEAMEKQAQSMPGDDAPKELEKRYWSAIAAHMKKTRGQNMERITSARTRKKPILWPAIGIAASTLFAVISFIYIINSLTPEAGNVAGGRSTNPAPEWVQIKNTKNTSQQFTLPDGSTVALEPESNIKLSPVFNESMREIRLEGAAFFDVAHDEQRPFMVHANDVTTKVLGTCFTVRAFPSDKNVTVAVKRGKVSVCANPQKDPKKKTEIILTPNQEIVYDKDEAKISRRIVKTPEPILPAAEIERMRFEEAPVREIFKAMEKVYGVDIEFDEALFSSCTLTTSVSDGDLYNKLGIITRAIGATYTLDENTIVISGPGCN